MERQRENWEGPRGDLHPYANRTASWKITGKDLSGGPPLNPVVLASEGWVEALLKVSAEHRTVSRPLFWGLAAALDLVPHGNLCQAIPAPVGTHAMAGQGTRDFGTTVCRVWLPPAPFSKRRPHHSSAS